MSSDDLELNICGNGDIPMPIHTELLTLLKEKHYLRFIEVFGNTTRESFDVNHFYEYPEDGTLLDIACRSKGNGKFVRVLVMYGAEVDVINKIRGKAPIHEAVETCDLAMVKVLVERTIRPFDCPSIISFVNLPKYNNFMSHRSCGSDWNMNDMQGRTPAMIAAYHAHQNIISVFLENENVSLDMVAGKTILHSLIDGMYEIRGIMRSSRQDAKFHECLDYILKNLPKDKLKVLMNNPQSLLQYASTRLHDDRIIKTLSISAGLEFENIIKVNRLCDQKFEHNGDVDCKSVYEKLLNFLKQQNYFNFAEILSKKPMYFDVNHFYEDPDNGTLLDIACRMKCHSQFVKLLIKRGAAINTINKISGKAPIHEAVENDDNDTVNALVHEKTPDGCDVNINDILGQTPIMKAAYFARKNILSALLQNEDVSLRPVARKTVLHMVVNGWRETVGAGGALDEQYRYCECLDCIIKEAATRGALETLLSQSSVPQLIYTMNKLLHDVFIESCAESGCVIPHEQKKFQSQCRTVTDHGQRVPQNDDNSHLPSLHSILLTLLKSKNFEEFEKTLNNNETFAVDHFYSEEKGTLLDIACRSPGNSRIVSIILKHEIDINLINPTTGKTAIHEATLNSDVETLEILLQDGKCDINMVDSSGYTVVEYAVMRDSDRFTFLETLSDYGATLPEIKNESQHVLKWGNIIRRCSAYYLPIMRSARYGNYETFKVLLERMDKDSVKYTQITSPPSMQERTVLHMVIQGIMAKRFQNEDRLYRMYRSLGQLYFICDMDVWVPPFNFSLFPNETQDHHRLLQFILQNKKLSWCLDAVDSSGNTALHYAVAGDDEISILALLLAGADMIVENKKGTIVFPLISSAILERFFDSCITCNNRPLKQKECTISFNYRMCLFPLNENCHDITPILHMTRSRHHRHLLRHPLITSYLNLKWNLMRKCFYYGLVKNFIHCFFINWYVISRQSFLNPRLNNTVTSPVNESVHIHNTNQSTYIDFEGQTPLIMEGFKFFVLLSILLPLGQAAVWVIIQIISWFTFAESCNLSEDLVNFVVYFTSLVYFILSINYVHYATFSAVVIWLSWMLLLYQIGRHPSFVIPVETLKTVSWNFFKFLLPYSIMILGFAFSFFILFKQQPVKNCDKNMFLRLPTSVFKTLIMLTGEFDATSIPFTDELGMSHVFFALFVILVSIILVNLWNGLAVGDTQKIVNDAEMIGILSQVEFIHQVEHRSMNYDTIKNDFEGNGFVKCLIMFIAAFYCLINPTPHKNISPGFYLPKNKSVEVRRTGETKPKLGKIDQKIIADALEILKRNNLPNKS